MTISELSFIQVKCESCQTSFGPLFTVVDRHYNRINLRMCRRCVVIKLGFLGISENEIDTVLLQLAKP